MDKWEYSCLIEEKILWEKKKLLVACKFSFSNNVFKSCLLLMRQNDLWSKTFLIISVTSNQHLLLFSKDFLPYHREILNSAMYENFYVEFRLA